VRNKISDALTQLTEASQQTVQSLRQSNEAIGGLNQVCERPARGGLPLSARVIQQPLRPVRMALFLQFQIGDDGYVVEATQVIRVLPLVASNTSPMLQLAWQERSITTAQRCLSWI